MILHDWQRGRIPFFVEPPKEDVVASSEAEAEAEAGAGEEITVPGIDKEAIADNSQAAAALKAIAGIMSSQQQNAVTVQRNFFDKDGNKAMDSTETGDENGTDAQEDDEDAVSEDGMESESDSDEDVVSENEEENDSDSAQ